MREGEVKQKKKKDKKSSKNKDKKESEDLQSNNAGPANATVELVVQESTENKFENTNNLISEVTDQPELLKNDANEGSDGPNNMSSPRLETLLTGAEESENFVTSNVDVLEEEEIGGINKDNEEEPVVVEEEQDSREDSDQMPAQKKAPKWSFFSCLPVRSSKIHVIETSRDEENESSDEKSVEYVPPPLPHNMPKVSQFNAELENLANRISYGKDKALYYIKVLVT
jgi:hypothetical protein